jgi:hypothetical protein
MQHQGFGVEVVDDLAQTLKARIDSKRKLERGLGLVQVSVPEADLAEARDGREVPRLKPQRLLDVAQAVRVPFLDEVECGALVPGLRPIRVKSEEPVEHGAGRLQGAAGHGLDGLPHGLLRGLVLVRNPESPNEVLDLLRRAAGMRLRELPEEVDEAPRQLGARLALAQPQEESEHGIDGEGGSGEPRRRHG